MLDPELLFDFSQPAAAEPFNAVDDRVMGGVSRSALRTAGNAAVFEGNLSTERNGGFASVRSTPAHVDLSVHAGIAPRVRGDGRTYELRLRTDSNPEGLSYLAPFPTTPGILTTVQLPFGAFRASYRGRTPKDAAPLDPSRVMSFGLLIAREQIGPFRLEIEWIAAFAD